MPARKSSASVRFGDDPVSHVAVLTACVPPFGRSQFETTTSESLRPSSGLRIGDISNPAPVVFGVQNPGRSPIGMNTAPKRIVGVADVRASAVAGGTMASRKGSASEAPMPRNTAGRDNDVLV